MRRRSSSVLASQSSRYPSRCRQCRKSPPPASRASAQTRSERRTSETSVRLIPLRCSTTVMASASTGWHRGSPTMSRGRLSSCLRYSPVRSSFSLRGCTMRASSGPLPSGVKPTGSRPASWERNCSSQRLSTDASAFSSPAAARSSTPSDGSSGRSSRALVSPKRVLTRRSRTCLISLTAARGERRTASRARCQSSGWTSSASRVTASVFSGRPPCRTSRPRTSS